MLSALLCLEAARALRSKSKEPEESWSTDPAVEIAPGFASSGMVSTDSTQRCNGRKDYCSRDDQKGRLVPGPYKWQNL